MLTFTGPVAVPEQYSFQLSRLHIGYALHNFGPALLTSQETVSTSDAWLTEGWAGVQWFHTGTGTAAAGAVIGEGAGNSVPLTIELDGPAAAGNHLLIGCAVIGPPFVVPPLTAADITITDNQGAGTVEPNTANQVFYGGTWQGGTGYNAVVVWGFNLYHLTAPLGAGDTITIDFPNWTVLHLQARVHVLTNVRHPDPWPQDPPGAFLGWSSGPMFLPDTSTFVPTITWIGLGLLTGSAFPVNNNVIVPGSLVPFDLNIARGVAVHRPAGALSPGDHLIQMPSGDIVLTPGCKVVIDTMYGDGSPRGTDSFSDIQFAITDLSALAAIE